MATRHILRKVLFCMCMCVCVCVLFLNIARVYQNSWSPALCVTILFYIKYIILEKKVDFYFKKVENVKTDIAKKTKAVDNFCTMLHLRYLTGF